MERWRTINASAMKRVNRNFKKLEPCSYLSAEGNLVRGGAPILSEGSGESLHSLIYFRTRTEERSLIVCLGVLLNEEIKGEILGNI